mgnify:FL=1
MKRPFIQTLLLLSLILPLELFAKEKILWVKWKLTPEYMETGKFEGQGFLDKFLEHTMALMPEYEHESQFQTLNRINLSWAQGNVCSLHLWLGYWPDQIVYSKPYAFTPRFGIITRNDSELANELGDKQSVSLEYLLNKTDYKMGILPLYYEGTRNARYPLLAPFISPHLNSNKVFEFDNGRNEMTIKIIDKRRVDYIIRQQVTHFSELRIDGRPDNYKFYSLDEGKRHKLVAGACSNSELGKSVIKQFNTLINDDFHKKYLGFRQEWDKNNLSFEKTFNDYFFKGIANPIITE